jgi:type II secretory pathway predicted ATPase ExeA
MSMSEKHRFSLTHYPLPKDAQGKTCYDKSAGYGRFARAFQQLVDEPGLGVLTAEAGVGKTAAIRNLCAQMPEPDFRTIYNCDTAVSPFDLYRTLALDLGLKPSHRRAQLWWDLKRAITHLVEEQHTLPILVLDEAQLLSDRFLVELCGFLNYAFDRRTLLTVWLVGLPALEARLCMQHHAPLASRIVGRVRLEPLSRDDFRALVDHGIKAAGCKDKLLTDSALEILWRASHGVARAASRLLRAALRQAHHDNQNLVDDHVLTKVIDELTPKQEDKP